MSKTCVQIGAQIAERLREIDKNHELGYIIEELRALPEGADVDDLREALEPLAEEGFLRRLTGR